MNGSIPPTGFAVEWIISRGFSISRNHNGDIMTDKRFDAIIVGSGTSAYNVADGLIKSNFSRADPRSRLNSRN